MVGLTPQLQTGVPGFPLSSWPPKLPIVAPPIDRGRMHDQQMSVIGFGKRPVQVAIDAAGAQNDARQSRAQSRDLRADLHRTVTSSMRSLEPSCETMAGTPVMPSLRTSVPSWS
jgi:hypothetical protein